MNSKEMRTYRLHSSTGPRFSFNAKNETEANDKMWNWLRYHSMTVSDGDFEVKEISDNDKVNDLHNEWVS